ncbi:MAG: zinc metallopeptidase [Pseudomonadota bacterium]|nr:zinc metallopeptidase [Pseudomonadota bacterium]
MGWLIIFTAFVLLVFLPGIWVKFVLKKYSRPVDRYIGQGNGAEFARHLLEKFNLTDISVEQTDLGDHYDPIAGAVRLSKENYEGYSLTAITVAAHEVGHAIQHFRGERLFRYRQWLVRIAMIGEKVGSILLVGAPIIMLVARIPYLSAGMLVIGFGSMVISAIVHFVTLPVELDASFNKALPVLEQGKYLQDGDLPHARKILKAAAFTYVAASLAGLMNLRRWITILRR